MSHFKTLNETGFWGKAGAGCMIYSRDTSRFLLPLRSPAVEQPGTWGTWGGAIERGEIPLEAAMRECGEELGANIQNFAFTPLSVFKSGDFLFHNFLALTDAEFSPALDWETERAVWVRLADFPKRRHFGLVAIMENPAALAKLKRPRA